MNKSLVDNAWNFGCGALNAGYLKEGNQGKKKKKRGKNYINI